MNEKLKTVNERLKTVNGRLLKMSAQHKRPGRTARQERIQRADERRKYRKYRENVVVRIPGGRKRYDGFPGRIMAIGIPPREEIA